MTATDVSNGLDMYEALMLSKDDHHKWCNYLHTSRCPRSNSADGLPPCTYQHLNVYYALPVDERPKDVLCLMTRHAKNLTKEMTRLLFRQAHQAMTAWFVAHAWDETRSTPLADANPFGEIVATLRAFGWVIPESDKQCTSMRVEDAPYADEVTAIITVSASMLHFQLSEAPEVMLRTVLWALEMDAEEMKSVVACAAEDSSCMGQLYDGDSSMPRLLDDAAHTWVDVLVDDDSNNDIQQSPQEMTLSSVPSVCRSSSSAAVSTTSELCFSNDLALPSDRSARGSALSSPSTKKRRRRLRTASIETPIGY